MELEAESKPQRTWTPVLQVPEETVAVATFQWKRVPLTRAVLLRLGAIAAAIVVACGLLAFGVSEMLPKTYGARIEIVYPLDANISSGSTLRQDRVLSTQLVAIKSRAVLTQVAPKYHLTPDALSKKILASILQDSEVIRIEVDDASQARALKMVTDVSNAYLKNVPSSPTAKVESGLKDQINALNAQISTYTSELATAQLRRLQSSSPNTPSAEEGQLQTQLNNANAQVSNLQAQLNQATVNNLQSQHVEPLTQPYEAGKVAPKPMRAGIAGVLAGMMIAAGVVVLLVRRRLRNVPVDQFG